MSRTEKVRQLRRDGMSIDEICERLREETGKEARHEVLEICRKMGLPITQEEHLIAKQRQDRQWNHDNAWADEYIRKKTDGRFYRISDYINMDSSITIRCNECGNFKTINFCSLRGNRQVCCLNCAEKELKERKEREKIEKQKVKEQKALKKAELKRIKACSGKQITMRFCIDCNTLLINERERCIKCRKRIENKNHEIKRRTKVQNAMVDRDISLDKLITRDKGVCHICGLACNCNDYVMKDGTIITGNNYPSIDHVIPLAKGGKHSWENVKLAHRICNSLKSDSI